jgi:hypothetical protein
MSCSSATSRQNGVFWALFFLLRVAREEILLGY